jgi:prevent-host-death family protein
MEKASITQTKNSLSAYLDKVKRGQTILITDRGRPVARLVAAVEEPDAEAQHGRLERLERGGIARRGRSPEQRPALSGPPPRRKRRSPSALAALLDEREGGR